MNWRAALLTTLASLGAFGAWQWRRQQERNGAVCLKDKVVVITGASSGIGRAAATVFAAQGAHLVLIARRAQVLEAIADELAHFQRRILCLPLDLSDAAGLDAAVQQITDEFGRIDVLVNSAGLTMGGYLENQDLSAIRRMIDLNLSSTIHLTRAVLPTMKAQGSGHIVNVSSVSGFIYAPGQSTYSATKAGLNAFSDGLRRELAGTGVHVSIIMPGWTKTPMISHVKLDKFPGYREGLIRLDTPEYVASHLVAAVRYKRQRVRLGGIGFGMVGFAERLSHTLVDIWMALVWNKEELINIESDMG